MFNFFHSLVIQNQPPTFFIALFFVTLTLFYFVLFLLTFFFRYHFKEDIFYAYLILSFICAISIYVVPLITPLLRE